MAFLIFIVMHAVQNEMLYNSTHTSQNLFGQVNVACMRGDVSFPREARKSEDMSARWLIKRNQNVVRTFAGYGTVYISNEVTTDF